ncbi:MAG TPA: hypothetical protein VLE69_00500 [Candidatus Saccharimonadales bacterium]|nr:hypothetical protein [Candidatus Saccharimonadales bacterium]
MAETAIIDLGGALREVLEETPWIEDKFTAIRGLFMAFGTSAYLLDPRSQTKLLSIGDSEFSDWRVAIRYQTNERVAPIYRSYDGRDMRYRVGSLTMSRVNRELSGFIREEGIVWTRSNEGLLVGDIAKTLAAETGTLTLGLSDQYARILGKPL